MKIKKLMYAAVLTLFAAVPTLLASTTWYVNGVSGSDNNNCTSPTTACKTVGHAISLASSGDSIMAAAATYTENLNIGSSLRTVGSGSGATIIDGGGTNSVITISNASAHVILSKLFIRNGFSTFGGGIANAGANAGTLTISNCTISGNIARGTSSAGVGAGIANSGTVTIINSSLIGNRVSGPFGAGFGGGIYNLGTATIKNSTLSNIASGSGGGIYNTGGWVLTINNSTLNSNSASLTGSRGGGIYNQGKMVAINNSTITGNKAIASGGGIYNAGPMVISSSTISGNQASSGGGIFMAGAVDFQNSIIANSPSGGNCSGDTPTSTGYNLSSDGTCNFSGAGGRNNTDPLLGPLQGNGGPTQTMALRSGSPAVDAGNPNGCTDGLGHLLKTDQRGKPRPDIEDTGGCDMGAYERQSD